MSTHALVGVAVGDGFQARYVHFDGYPSAMLPALRKIMSWGDGSVDYILGNHWESLNLSSRTPAEPDSHEQTWYTESSTIDHEYLYLLDGYRKSITSFINLDNKWVEINPNNTIKNKER